MKTKIGEKLGENLIRGKKSMQTFSNKKSDFSLSYKESEKL